MAEKQNEMPTAQAEVLPLVLGKKQSRFKRTLKECKRHSLLLVMAGFVLVWYFIFLYGPMYGLLMAFKDFSFRKGVFGSNWKMDKKGNLDLFANFTRMFKDHAFLRAFRNTFVISGLKLLIGFPVPIVFALLLNEIRNRRYKKLVQTVSYLPYFISWIVLSGIMRQILNLEYGLYGYLVRYLGFPDINFLTYRPTFRGLLVISSIWRNFGWSSIIYLAALGGIDGQLYEAAEIDGAGRWKKAIHITLPGLAPVIVIQLILQVGTIVGDDFNQIFNLYSVPVYEVADVIGTYTYRQSFQDSTDFSYSTAVGLMQNTLSFVLIIITNWITSKFSEYGIW